jgi:predicted YcjX-like family ATPase
MKSNVTIQIPDDKVMFLITAHGLRGKVSSFEELVQKIVDDAIDNIDYEGIELIETIIDCYKKKEEKESKQYVCLD